MNKTEIKNTMRIVREAIWLVYGRQPLKLVAYSILDSKPCFTYREIDYMPNSLWVEVQSERGNHFKAKIEKGEVLSLVEGRLNV